MNALLPLQHVPDENRTHPFDRISFRTIPNSPRISYYLYTPRPWSEGLRVLVSVHGISQNAAEHAMQLANLCQQQGLALVAPLFTRENFPGYQRLGLSRKRGRPRADLALDAVLDDVAALTGADTSRVLLFGYSGGGQFAHRYAMLHPQRVIRAALGAPGWYTFPDSTTPYPRGFQLTQILPGAGDNPIDHLRVPMAVFVGEYDCHRDPGLNTAPPIDRQQGFSRVDRGQRWIDAMRHAAAAAGLNTRYEFHLLEHSAHSFLDCMTNGNLGRRALEFLLDGIRPNTTQRTNPIRNWTPFIA